MHRIAIVDDNVDVVEDLSTNVPWSSYNIRVVGRFTSAAEALEATRQGGTGPPLDLFICDIKMPGIDGVEFVHEVLSREPSTKVVFISAHREFEYVREALRVGAADYVTKPLDKDRLLDVVRGALRRRDQERFFRAEVERLKPVIEEELFRSTVQGDINADFALHEFAYLNIQVLDQVGFCAVVRLSGPERELSWVERNAGLLEVKDDLAKALNRFHHHLFRLSTDTVGVIVEAVVGNAERVRQEVGALLARLPDSITPFGDGRITIGVGNTATGTARLPVSFEQAQLALEQHYRLGPGVTIFYSDIQAAETTRATVHYPLEHERSLLAGIRLGDVAQTREAVGELFRHLSEQDPTVADLVPVLSVLLSMAMRTVLELGGASAQDPVHRLDVALRAMFHASSAGELFRHAEATLVRLAAFARECIDDRDTGLVDRANAIIDNHYSDPNLGVPVIADELGLSSNYLSHVYSVRTGTRISDRIVERRIESAKVLLQISDSLIREVASRVGFSSQRYFSTRFKRLTGMTPREFKEVHLNSDDVTEGEIDE